MKPFKQIADFLFAPRAVCMGCQSVRGAEEGWLCSNCLSQLKPMYAELGEKYCARCGRAITGRFCSVCPANSSGVFMARAAYEYVSPVSGIVHSFKYRGAYRMDAWMGGEIAKLVISAGMTDADYIVSVPMHFTRKFRRGYNQAEKLARAAARALGMKYINALKRTRATRSQSKLSGEARRRNLDNAFRADNSVSGKVILLIDDVRTTGTTALKCAQALKEAGAKRVMLATFAATR